MPSVADPLPSQALLSKTLKSTEEALLALNQEIEQALTIRNSFVPINLLPAEVFANILTHLKDPSGGEPTDVVAASHVCRHWRAIAVGTPQLWTTIALANVDLVKEFLERSDPLPLHLSVGKRGAAFLDLALATEDDMHRVASLDAQFQGLEDLTVFASHFVDPAPALRTLRLALATAESSDSLEEDFQPPPIISRLCPNVNVVSATNLFFPLFDSRTGITTLHLDGALPDFVPLLQMLSHCSSLQELLIVGEPPIAGWGDLSVELDVDLPLAHTITLRIDFMPIALALLAHLVFPETAAVRVEMLYSSLEDTSTFGAVPLIPCTEKLPRWTVDWVSTYEVLVSGWTAGSRGPPCVQLAITARADSHDASFPPLLQCDWPLYIDNITDLTFDLRGRPLGSTDVAGFYYYGSWFGNLETLRLRRPAQDAVVCLSRVLCDFFTTTLGDSPEEYTAYRLPSLRKVEVSNFVWNHGFFEPLWNLAIVRDELARGGHAVACAVELADVVGCPLEDGRTVHVARARVVFDGEEVSLAES